MEDNINAYQEIWDTLKREQDNMEDKAEDMDDEDSQTAGIYASNAAMLKSSASRIYIQLDTMTSEKSTPQPGKIRGYLYHDSPDADEFLQPDGAERGIPGKAG